MSNTKEPLNVSPVIGVEKSANTKTGTMSVTWAAQQSCPTDCVFKSAGCYAEKGHAGIHTRRINKTQRSIHKIAREEANTILKMSGKRVLRLHVVGDCPTPRSAQLVSRAARVYKRRHNKDVYTYTHAWRKVSRKYWDKSVSVLASVHNAEEAAQARLQGYAPALGVEKFPNKAKTFVLGEVTYIPCPEQAQKAYGKNDDPDKKITCLTCKLCFDSEKLFNKMMGIAFAKH